MMAIGWSRLGTMASIVMEGALIGSCGCALGVAFGYAASLLFSSMPMIGDYISFHPTVAMLAPTLAASVALCVLGSLYPAWRATSLSPSEALRRA
jgi:putative ABC transport system permease protein